MLDDKQIKAIEAMKDDEQWRTDGKCYQCRRRGYCKTDCKKHRQKVQDDIFNTFMDCLVKNH